ncbi:MAG: diaminopimelate decarboxylase, partial [Actinomycetota bacterium]|nr:diaminopimelate decarboxylase [Actinomycetota bacterium]
MRPWPATASWTADGLSIAGRPAAELAEEHGTPLVVVDEDDVRSRCREFNAAFDRALWAVKAFPVAGLIRVAADEGLGLLAATGGEVEACLRAGVRPDRIMLHGNNKSDGELALAVEAGVGLVSIDNEEEVDRLAEAASAAGRAQDVLLRVIPGVDADTHEYVKTGMTDTKFGMPVPDALSALKRAIAV